MNLDIDILKKYGVEENDSIRLVSEVYQEYLAYQLLYYILQSDAITQDKNAFDVHEKSREIQKRNIELMGLVHLEIVKKDDVRKLFDFIVKEEVNLLKNTLKRFNKNDLVIVYYSLASYIAELHGRIYVVMSDANSINEFENLRNSERYLISTISALKEERYKISGLLGMDKVVVQYIFSLITDLPDIKNNSCKVLDRKALIDIFITSAAIIQTIGERELLLSKFHVLNKIEIKDSLIIIPGELYNKFSEFTKELFEDEQKLGLEDGASDELFAMLDENIYKTLGFRYKTLDNFISNTDIRKPIDDRLATLADKEFLVNIITKGGECSKAEAESLIEYLTMEEKIDNNYYLMTIDRFKTRLFKNSLVRANVIGTPAYLLSFPLFFYSLFLLRRHIVYDLIQETKGVNSGIIKEEVKNKLVETVYKVVSKYSGMCYCNTYDLDIDISCKLRRIHFHREIDALFMINNKLFITECKDRVFKFTSFGFKREIGLCIEDINVMLEKYEEVKKYIKELEVLFNNTINEIVMVIVYRHYNSAKNSDIDLKGVHIASITEFEGWLQMQF